MGKGSRMVHEKNFLPNTTMEMGLGVLFRSGDKYLHRINKDTVIDFGMVVCAPYMAMNDYDFKVKVKPSGKKSDKGRKKLIESAIKKMELQIDIEVLRWSNANAMNAKTAQVLIIDQIGLLRSMYTYANIAYIGGGFGKGIHNTLEAATFGMPIFIGPNNENFQEANDLKALGAAIEISSAQEMIAQCDLLLTRQNKWDELKQKSSNYVQNRVGATDKIYQMVFQN